MEKSFPFRGLLWRSGAQHTPGPGGSLRPAAITSLIHLEVPTMKLHAAIFALALAVSSATTFAQAVPALDDPNTVVTEMQLSARSAATRAQSQERMGAIRDYIRKQPGYIENALMENRNTGSKPDLVGVSRWKSFKDWEALWLEPEFEKLVAAVGEVGDINPGTYSPLKR
jgi:heme-degrading monooxygenase HmoA